MTLSSFTIVEPGISKMCNTARRADSPTRLVAQPTQSVTACSQIQENAARLLAVARHVDSGATISAVTKANDSSTLVKIQSSPNIGTTMTLATLTALRVAFPFSSFSATECVASGNTQFVVILKSNIEEIRHAKQLCREFRSMKVMKIVSNGLLIAGLCCYVALVYAKTITQLESL